MAIHSSAEWFDGLPRRLFEPPCNDELREFHPLTFRSASFKRMPSSGERAISSVGRASRLHREGRRSKACIPYHFFMKKILFSLIVVALFVSGCSCLEKGRGLTEQDILLLQANPHVPLTL